MKKKNLSSKLQLSKKTIAKLNDNAMQDIQGGASLPQCINIQTNPVICRPIPTTTIQPTTTTIINSRVCPSLACTITSGGTSVINPAG